MIKLNHSIDFLKYQSMSEGLIKRLNVNDIILLISKIGNQLSTPLISILSHINGRSLWESCNSVGYLMLTSSRYPLIFWQQECEFDWA